MDFKAILPVELFKIFSTTLDVLSHLGDEVTLNVTRHQFAMSIINNSLTAQAIVRISPLFFEAFKLSKKQSQQDTLQCRVPTKGMNQIFKKNQNIANLIRNCEIHIEENDETSSSRLHLKILCQNGVTKKNTIWYSDGEIIDELYSKDQEHSIIISPSLLKDYVDLFHPKVVDIVFEFTPTFIIFKSFWDSNASHLEKPVQSSFKIKATDCIEYAVTQPIKLIFNLKDFKAILNYMELMEAELHAHFDKAGHPIIFTYEQNNEIMADFSLMTYSDISTERQGSISFNEHSIASVESYDRLVSPGPSFHRRNTSSRPASNHPGKNSSIETISNQNVLGVLSHGNRNMIDSEADTVPVTESSSQQSSGFQRQSDHRYFPFGSSVESNGSSRPTSDANEHNTEPSSKRAKQNSF